MLRFKTASIKAGLILGCMSTIVAIDMLNLLPISPTSQATFAAPKKRPYRRASGGKRGVCPSMSQTSSDLMVFLPQKSDRKDLTATKAPQFYFYVPDQPSDVASLEFRLEYASGPKRKQAAINRPMNIPFNQTGLVKVQLPEILEPETDYKWSFTLRCVTDRETVAFSGLVRHQALDSVTANQITQAPTAADKATLYAQKGLELDAMAALLENQSGQSQSLTALLATVGLTTPGSTTPGSTTPGLATPAKP
jgi:hypothetical protein